ncbi:glycosyl transferase [Labedella phragmitis]|uniref:Glycosyl transferase n=1 Tax=Labedella phragmitis TaxID=2498849 RepID=A0A3S4A3V7_9MICO|nr:glycosyltransferase [Labedella phragmitis]RWZ50888.1 glycosyl transferase [Labedella phragmitis]
MTRTPLRVQQSFPDPRPTTNPYIVMLRDELAATDGVDVRTFSWASALFGRYDVFHAHWPEILVSGHSPLKTAARQVLTALLVARWRLTATAVVRTVHNLHRPEGLSRSQGALLGAIERATVHAIVLNESTVLDDSTVLPSGTPTTLVLHGHYRDWFSRFPQREAQRGRFSYFGLIRRYKGVDALLRAFRGLPGDYSLRVAGKARADALADELVELAASDDRVDLTLEFLSEAELVDVARQGEIVVLPYREMHNSGGALAALSVDRPVLVPANEVNSRLADEVGPGWVLQYDGEIDADILERAITTVRAEGRSPRPDLSARDWDRAGRGHLEAYEAAVASRSGRRRGR